MERAYYYSHLINMQKNLLKNHYQLSPNGCLVAMFLPIRYTEGKARKKLFQAYPPKNCLYFNSRLKCAINGNFDAMKGSATSYAWFVWEKGHKGKNRATMVQLSTFVVLCLTIFRYI